MCQVIIAEIDNIINKLNALKGTVLENCLPSEKKPRFRVRKVPPEQVAKDRVEYPEWFTDNVSPKGAKGGKTKKYKTTNNKSKRRK